MARAAACIPARTTATCKVPEAMPRRSAIALVASAKPLIEMLGISHLRSRQVEPIRRDQLKRRGTILASADSVGRPLRV